jgi:electron transport complex protein RnfB
VAVLVPVMVVGATGLVFGIGLSIAARRFAVQVDRRISQILGLLPGANCGACGYPGCSGFAKAVAEGKAQPNGCAAGGAQVAGQIAEVLGVTAAAAEPMMAVVQCKGGKAEAVSRASYAGLGDCNAAVLAGNGPKVCQEGCLGLGTCVAVCPFDAIHVNANGVAVVDPEKCTGCGMCVKACPRKIISLIPAAHKIYLACSNHDRGARVKKNCSVGCTACTLCVKATPSGAITLANNLPALDYSTTENFVVAANKCPSKCFVDLVKKRPVANIDTKCDGCGACVPACPVKAIAGETGKRHEVDKARCIGCGICVDVCPAKAISMWGGLGYGAGGGKARRMA